MLKNAVAIFFILLIPLHCQSLFAQTFGDVRCSITSIHLARLEKHIPLNQAQYADGQVEVLCHNTSQDPQNLELKIYEVKGHSILDESDGYLSNSSKGISVELFADDAGRPGISLRKVEQRDYSASRTLPGASKLLLFIPFHAKVVVESLIDSGAYDFNFDIGLLHR